jgi:isopenicillin N synthase-like dioxygenase
MYCFRWVGKIALFCKFWSVRRFVRFANVCNVRWVSFVRWKKKQNKFHQACTDLSTRLFFTLAYNFSVSANVFPIFRQSPLYLPIHRVH